jgi:hypothetical protein
MHVHVQSAVGEAKFWIEPSISLAHNYGLNESDLHIAEGIVHEHKDELREAWRQHFGH